MKLRVVIYLIPKKSSFSQVGMCKILKKPTCELAAASVSYMPDMLDEKHYTNVGISCHCRHSVNVTKETCRNNVSNYVHDESL